MDKYLICGIILVLVLIIAGTEIYSAHLRVNQILSEFESDERENDETKTT